LGKAYTYLRKLNVTSLSFEAKSLEHGLDGTHAHS